MKLEQERNVREEKTVELQQHAVVLQQQTRGAQNEKHFAERSR